MKETALATVVGPSEPAPSKAIDASPPGRSLKFARALTFLPLRGLGRAFRAVTCRPGRTCLVLLLAALTVLAIGLVGAQLWAWYHFKAGQSALEQYHDAQAKLHLQACLKVWPKDPDVLLLACRAARRLKSFELAGQFLDQYKQVRGEDDALMLERALLRAQRGDVDAVEGFCWSLLDQHHAASSLIYEALACGYIRTYRFADASQCLERWREKEPDNCRALSLRGQVFDLQVDQQEAVACYRRVVELDPEQDEARARLAAGLVDLAQPAEALPHLEYLRGRQPHDPSILLDYARCQDLLGEHAEAEQILADVCARFPQNGLALAEYGKLLVRGRRPAEAEPLLREACRLEPNDYQAHYQLAQCLEQAHKREEARQLQVKLKQIEADTKRVREIVTTLMPRSPHDADLHYELGMIFLRSGAIVEALRWLESALKENPQHVATHQALAQYYQRVGQGGRAARHLQLAHSAAAVPPAAAVPGGPAP
jgi:predicted Zn-dependent protease